MPSVTNARQLGYTQQRGANGQFGRVGGEGNIGSLYYYPAGEPRKVTNMQTGQVTRGGGAVAASIAGAGRFQTTRRSRGTTSNPFSAAQRAYTRAGSAQSQQAAAQRAYERALGNTTRNRLTTAGAGRGTRRQY